MNKKNWVSRGTLLDEGFDRDDSPPDEYERMVFGSFDGDMLGRPEKGNTMGQSMSARRKRRTVNTDDPETVVFPNEAPEGWAKP